MQTRKTLLSVAVLGTLAAPAVSIAQSAPAAEAPTAQAAPASPHTLTANVNLVSEYRFRGIDQTWGSPALQGGADYGHASGLYAGVWASNVSGNIYPGGSLEFDYYGGYNGKIGEDFGFTAGFYGYYYPRANFDKSAVPSAAGVSTDQTPDNFELNVGVSWKWISYKLSYAITDYFGADQSLGYDGGTRGTLYNDLSASIPLPWDLTLGAHVGYTAYKADYICSGQNIDPSYWDWKVSLAKAFKDGWNASIAYVQANNDDFWRPPCGGLSYANMDTRDLNKAVAVLQVGRTF
jgi:uncharacterized protein (TIGR02001 family)